MWRLKGVPIADRVTLYNVIAELPGATDEFVLVTAHLDSTAKGSYTVTTTQIPRCTGDGR